jgi:toxin ParE1/3/4
VSTALDELRGTCQFLAEHPGAGELQQDLPSKTLRAFSVHHYVIFFRPLKDGAEIGRVIHGARDWPTVF